MAIQIGNYNFDGPLKSFNQVRNASGIYVILGKASNGNWDVVDIGESGSLQDRLRQHDRGSQWQRRGHAELSVAVAYADERNRMLIERELRACYNPPCGDR